MGILTISTWRFVIRINQYCAYSRLSTVPGNSVILDTVIADAVEKRWLLSQHKMPWIVFFGSVLDVTEKNYEDNLRPFNIKFSYKP
jgi:hypothetical protein